MNITLLQNDPFTDIIGQAEAKKQLKIALLSQRNVVIVGPPGIGKTTLTKNVSKLMPDKPFVRVQGSPDLTAEDLLGDIDPIKALEFGALSQEAFTPGKIFKAKGGILFFDELNRCPEKLQNALLQVLEEKKATIGSYDVDFDADFIFIGTMNPQDSSTEKVSNVLLDRFDVITISYPESISIEKQIVKEKGMNLGVKVPEGLLTFIVSFIHDIRTNENLERAPSVRATLGLYERSQANAKLKGHDTITMDDIKEIMASVLSHRIELKPSVRFLKDPAQFIQDELEKFIEENPQFSDPTTYDEQGDSL